MRPLDFYRLGVALAESAAVESLRRAVVGRLYYGLHHEACCRYFRENPGARPLSVNGRHTQLRNRYLQSERDDGEAVGVLLRRMILLRIEADYQLAPPLRFENRSIDSAELMRLALDISRQLLAALDRYSPGAAPDGCRCPTVYSSR